MDANDVELVRGYLDGEAVGAFDRMVAGMHKLEGDVERWTAGCRVADAAADAGLKRIAELEAENSMLAHRLRAESDTLTMRNEQIKELQADKVRWDHVEKHGLEATYLDGPGFPHWVYPTRGLVDTLMYTG